MDSIFRLSNGAFASAVLAVYNEPALGRSWDQHTISAWNRARAVSVVALLASIGSVAFPVLRGPMVVAAIVVSGLGIVGCTWVISGAEQDNEVLAEVRRISEAAGILKLFHPEALTKTSIAELLNCPMSLQNKESFTRALAKLQGERLSEPRHAQMLLLITIPNEFNSMNFEQVAEAMIVFAKRDSRPLGAYAMIRGAKDPVGMAEGILLLEDANKGLLKHYPTLRHLTNPRCVAEGMCMLAEGGFDDIINGEIYDGRRNRGPLDLLIERDGEKGRPQQRASVMCILKGGGILDQFSYIPRDSEDAARALVRLEEEKVLTPVNRAAVCGTHFPMPMAEGLVLLKGGAFSDDEMAMLRPMLSAAGPYAFLFAQMILDMKTNKPATLGQSLARVYSQGRLAIEFLSKNTPSQEDFMSLFECEHPWNMALGLAMLGGHDAYQEEIGPDISTPENRAAVRAAKDHAVCVAKGLRALDFFQQSLLLGEVTGVLLRETLLKAESFAESAAKGIVYSLMQSFVLTPELCDVFANIRQHDYKPAVRALLAAHKAKILGPETYKTLSVAAVSWTIEDIVKAWIDWKEAGISIDDKQQRFRELGGDGMWRVALMTRILKDRYILRENNLSAILKLDLNLLRQAWKSLDGLDGLQQYDASAQAGFNHVLSALESTQRQTISDATLS